MGRVRKIGKEFFVEFEARGLIYQQKAGSDLAAAEQLLAEIEEKIRLGELGVVERDVDPTIFFEDFLDEARRLNPPRTGARFERAVRHFADFLRNSQPAVGRLSAVTPKVLEDYKACLSRRGAAPSCSVRVLNLTFILLREMFDFAIKCGQLNDNPALHLRFMAVSDRSLRVLSASERAQVRGRPEGTGWMINVMLETGLTLQETLALRWDDVDLAQDMIQVRGRRPGQARQIPLNANAARLLRARRPAPGKARGPAQAVLAGTFANVSDPLIDFWAGMNMAPLSFSVLRHTFAFERIGSGMSLVRLHRLMGLPDVAGVMRYIPWLRREENINKSSWA